MPIRHWRKVINGQRGSTALVIAVTLPVMLGAVGLGTDVSIWYATKRSMQNAADAAVLAASSNGSANYASEAQAVAAHYGYSNANDANVHITASNSAACPSGGSTCYSVTITGYATLVFSPMVGFTGNLQVGGVNAIALSASAVATQSYKYCLVALNTIGTPLEVNGGPQAQLSGCNLFSNSNADCNGNALSGGPNAPAVGNAHGTNSGCGQLQNSNVPALSDPFYGLARNIPGNTCASYPQEPIKHGDPPLPSANTWSGSVTISGNTIVCGDLKLAGDVTITSNGSAVLVIENGRLDTSDHFTLKTGNGSHLTVVFSGTNSGGYTHAPTGDGTLDFAAPTSGAWAGVAIYQDPSITSGVDISAAGNSPTWNITGLVYLPNSSVTFSGAVNKSSNGASCFVMMAKDIRINGTAQILSNGGCGSSGLTMPSTRGQLAG